MQIQVPLHIYNAQIRQQRNVTLKWKRFLKRTSKQLNNTVLRRSSTKI